MVRGAYKLFDRLQDTLGLHNGETSDDGLFTLLEVECLGACANAPMIQINDEYYVSRGETERDFSYNVNNWLICLNFQEDLTVEDVDRIIGTLKAGQTPKPGPQ